MKELSIEEKAKAYDRVREKIALRFGTDVAEGIFSEFEESEDERIRKGLINYFNHHKNGINIFYGIKGDDILAWLEKQGEQKQEINNFDVLPGLYKCVHRMFDGTPDGRLLFEVGNVYRCLSKHDRAEFEVSYGHSVYLEDPVVCKHFIPFEKQDEVESDNDDIEVEEKGIRKAFNKIWDEKQSESSDQIHYWTEEEIEPIISDYLRGTEHYGGMIARLRCLKPKSLEKQCKQKPQRMISAEAKEAMYDKPADKVEPKFKVGDSIKTANEEPLTITEITDNGYWSEDLFICNFDDAAKWELVEQKPADKVEPKCEESKTKIFDAPTPFEDKLYAFVAACEFLAIPSKIEFILEHSQEILDAAREQIGKERKTALSEEDENMCEAVIDVLVNNTMSGSEGDKVYSEEIDWLKSLKTRYTWKPSDEQMEALESATENCAYSEYQDCLRELIGQLKKLKENNV